jgi:hypothetical protein
MVDGGVLFPFLSDGAGAQAPFNDKAELLNGLVFD